MIQEIAMSYEATEIEKKSLEAHVELCAERYSALELRLDDLDDKIEETNRVVRDIRDMVVKITEKRNDQIIAWGLGIIGGLIATIGFLAHYILK
jgi:chromosome segregation ATPase